MYHGDLQKDLASARLIYNQVLVQTKDTIED